ncbi:zinc finger protein SHOOT GRAVITROPISM 5-like [Macadamia integrifolia]|uniref:zinc finger protein SHOOT GRAVITROPISM 5-like n=1 Tax=Macadamia integrifolia TaxID=60698 RepID=UPI001C501D5D|nr:zinc finger protein SHOOT GRAVITROPISM 5-like [Macadamia integrifolia]
MGEDDKKELQLLPSPSSTHLSASMMGSSNKSPLTASESFHGSLDLQLSISLRPFRRPSDQILAGPLSEHDLNTHTDFHCVEALKWQAAEQIRLAAIEKAYADRVRELTRREMELAQLEFARARQMWERAQEALEKAERMKENATHQIGTMCMEITCHACRQRFQPE